MLYAKGVELAKRMNFEDLLKHAKKDGILKPEEELLFDEFRHLRNAYAHFREPSHEFSSLRRSIKHDQPFDDLLQRDAQTALALLGRHLAKHLFLRCDFIEPWRFACCRIQDFCKKIRPLISEAYFVA